MHSHIPIPFGPFPFELLFPLILYPTPLLLSATVLMLWGPDSLAVHKPETELWGEKG